MAKITICPPGRAIGYIPVNSHSDMQDLAQDTLSIMVISGWSKDWHEFINRYENAKQGSKNDKNNKYTPRFRV